MPSWRHRCTENDSGASSKSLRFPGPVSGSGTRFFRRISARAATSSSACVWKDQNPVGRMQRIRRWTFDFLWPDVTNEEGRFVACSIGAAALLSIASTYGYLLLDLLSGDDHAAAALSENAHRILVLLSLGAGTIATIYLANRVWQYECQVAAWVSLLWIGYETVDAMLGITAGNPLIFLILLFASFQGVRGCFSLPDTVDGG